ncbi:TetR family transcriptional regulator [Microbacterium sp. cx-55]|uniref:TetR/AcrR family transcriptional regulator n=1 Tax=unclassified Microbacterium TaxID=2609290 RepID=UPI001CBF3A9D|nr:MULTISPECIES: TetR family transcriptional regulator [unclassified Microbacterium]MCC4908297.1 TetR family transcriptional regulator [Microbacterium sp. cx-59]UGB35574.1 TetR family transcriptional regulator [Microbacterium sp. cx-55]
MTTAEEWDALPLRRVPTQARSRDKVLRALVAADRLLRTEGPDAINLPRVAAEADVSVGALYQYLPDRDAITRALVARYHSRLELLLDDAIAQTTRSAAPADPVAHVIDAVAGVYLDQQPVRALHAVSTTPAGFDERTLHRQRMAAKVATLMRVSGLASDGRDELRARVAFLSADAVLHEAFAASGSERAALLAELQDMLRRFLTPSDPAR